MRLSNYNVNQQLVNFFNHYLTQSNIPFSTLKSYLVNQQAVSVVHQAVVNELNTVKENDKHDARIYAEENACTKQVKEDEDQKNTDDRDGAYQGHKKEQLIGERAVKNTLIMQHEAELFILTASIRAHSHVHGHLGTPPVHRHSAPIHTHTHPAPPPVHRHPDPFHTHAHPGAHPASSPVHQHPGSGNASNTHAHTTVEVQPDPAVLRAHFLRSDIATLNSRIRQINRELNQIEEQQQQRRENRKQRDERMQARVDLAQQKLGSSINSTLSSQNQLDLQKKIRDAHGSIDWQYNALVRGAQLVNYPLFTQQLAANLNLLKSSPEEIKALHQVLELMKQHETHTKAANDFNTQLTGVIKKDNDLNATLKAHIARVETLKNSNPSLKRQNEDLTAKNTDLDEDEQKNIKARDKLISPIKMLLAAAVVTSIPLILTLAGVLPLALSPVLLYSLLSTVPILSLATGLGLGITALVYYSKGAAAHKSIEDNKNTIQYNMTRMENNQQELLKLQNSDIPSCNKAIDDNITIKTQTVLNLQQAQFLAQQTKQQANDIAPAKSSTPYSAPLNSEKNVYTFFNPRPEASAPALENNMDLAYNTFASEIPMAVAYRIEDNESSPYTP
jgi:hypothetical protein